MSDTRKTINNKLPPLPAFFLSIADVESVGVWLRVDGSVDSNRRNELAGASADLEDVPK
jgi:hypothetical protein